MLPPCASAPAISDEIVRRRNQIVHEGGLRTQGETARSGAKQMSHAEADILFIEKLIDAIHEVVSH